MKWRKTVVPAWEGAWPILTVIFSAPWVSHPPYTEPDIPIGDRYACGECKRVGLGLVPVERCTMHERRAA